LLDETCFFPLVMSSSTMTVSFVWFIFSLTDERLILGDSCSSTEATLSIVVGFFGLTLHDEILPFSIWNVVELSYVKFEEKYDSFWLLTSTDLSGEDADELPLNETRLKRLRSLFVRPLYFLRLGRIKRRNRLCNDW
jgi:hypothetical protein